MYTIKLNVVLFVDGILCCRKYNNRRYFDCVAAAREQINSIEWQTFATGQEVEKLGTRINGLENVVENLQDETTIWDGRWRNDRIKLIIWDSRWWV